MAYRFFRMMFMAVILIASAEAAAVDQCQGLKFEQIQNLSLQDLGRMTQQEIVTGKPGSVVFIPFDEEDYPQQGKFRALGLVFARVGDLGETPIGGYIWISKEARSGGHRMTKEDRSISITFRTEGKQRCTTPQLDFDLRQMGKIYVNGDFIGAVK